MRGSALPDFSARQLEAVLALVEYGSFVAAAARLRVSQPALTRSVKRLETELGVRLFDRTTRRVQVTAAGREFAAVAERMLNDLGITVQSVREVAEERRGLVVLSSVMSVAGAFLPRLIAAYRADLLAAGTVTPRAVLRKAGDASAPPRPTVIDVAPIEPIRPAAPPPARCRRGRRGGGCPCPPCAAP